jgi:hypothetical protein
MSPFGDARGVRQPPRNYEAEQALLAALLANNAVFGQMVGMVTAGDFADPLHGRIFTAACRLIERGEIANYLTLRPQFDQDPALAEIGGSKYLAHLENSVVTILSCDDYARVIRDLADRRRPIFTWTRSRPRTGSTTHPAAGWPSSFMTVMMRFCVARSSLSAGMLTAWLHLCHDLRVLYGSSQRQRRC